MKTVFVLNGGPVAEEDQQGVMLFETKDLCKEALKNTFPYSRIDYSPDNGSDFEGVSVFLSDKETHRYSLYSCEVKELPRL